MSLADIFSMKAQQTAQGTYRLQSRHIEQNRGIQDSITSLNRSKSVWDDTASTVFTENWVNLTNWVTPTTSGVQVSGNQLYSTGAGGAASGANHSFALSSTDNMRAVFSVNVPSTSSSGGVMIGVSQDAPGAVPSSGGVNDFAIYFATGVLDVMDNGTTSAPVEGTTLTAGNYIVTITADEQYISISAVKTDESIEVCARKLRSSFNVNNLFVFNSDSRGLSGMSVGVCSARKGVQTITPKSFGEGVMKGIHWTGDGTQSFRVYVPKGYDSRIPNPVAICFHGNGTDETQWSINANMKTMQKALVDAGYIVLTCCLNSSKYTWGNTASTNAYFQAYNFLKKHYNISSVVIYANSMGGIESLNALAEGNIPCQAWIGTSPTYNLLNNYQNAEFTSVIQGAYNISSGGSNYSTQTNGRDPALKNPTAFRCVPMMILAAVDDVDVSKTANGDKLASDVQNTAYEVQEISVASGGHSFDITPYTSQMIAFFNKYSSF